MMECLGFKLIIFMKGINYLLGLNHFYEENFKNSLVHLISILWSIFYNTKKKDIEEKIIKRIKKKLVKIYYDERIKMLDDILDKNCYKIENKQVWLAV